MNITFIYFVLKQNRNSRNLLVCTNYFQSPVGRTVQTAAYYIQKYCHHCHHEWTFIKRISFKSNGCQRKRIFAVQISSVFSPAADWAILATIFRTHLSKNHNNLVLVRKPIYDALNSSKKRTNLFLKKWP